MERIEIQEFLNHEKTMMELGPCNLVFGPNGSGKSAIVSAIEWCMTGSCRDLDERGRRNQDLRRRGAEEETMVRLWGPDAPYASRVFDGNRTELQVSGAMGSVAETERHLWQTVGVKRVDAKSGRGMLRLFLRAGDLSTWSDRAWHEILAMLSEGGMVEILNDLSAYFGDDVAVEEKPVLAEYVNAARAYLAPSVGGLNSRAHVVSSFDRYFYEERRKKKKELAAAQARVAPDAEDPVLGAMGLVQLEENTRQLQGQVANLETQASQASAMLGRAQEATKQREKFKLRIAELDERKTVLQEVISTCPGDEHIEQALRSITAAKHKLREGEKEILEANKPEGLSEAARAVLDLTPDAGPKALSKTSRKKLATLTEDSALEGGIPVERQQQLDALRLNVTRLEGQHGDMVTRQRDAQKARAELEQNERTMATLTCPASADEAATTADLAEESLASTQAELASLRATLAAYSKEVERREYVAIAVQQATATLSVEVAALERLVEAFRHPLIKSGDGGEILQQMEFVIRESVGQLIPGCGEMTVGQDGSFRLGGRAWDVLSASEKLRFGCALTAGLSTLFGFPWLIIDGVELIVGGENRQRFFSWVTSQQQRFHKVVVIAATDSEENLKALPLGQDWKRWWVEGGTVRSV